MAIDLIIKYFQQTGLLAKRVQTPSEAALNTELKEIYSIIKDFLDKKGENWRLQTIIANKTDFEGVHNSGTYMMNNCLITNQYGIRRETGEGENKLVSLHRIILAGENNDVFLTERMMLELIVGYIKKSNKDMKKFLYMDSGSKNYISKKKLPPQTYIELLDKKIKELNF